MTDMPPNRSEAEWRALIRTTLASGYCFRAFDLSREALNACPGNLHLELLSALALVNVGDVTGARGMIPAAALTSDAMAAELLAEIYREAWRRKGRIEDLRQAGMMSRRAFSLEPTGMRGYFAAVLAMIGDRHDEALALAHEAVSLDSVTASPPDSGFAASVRRGLLALLERDHATAVAAFEAAGVASRHRYAWRVPLRRELAELAASGLSIPMEIDAAVPAPTVVLFSGPPVDPPGGEARCFLPGLEPMVAADLARQLDGMGAEIGYSSAEPGSDLLFIEAMLARGAEINIILPCAIDDFVARRIQPAGERWEAAFHAAMRHAHSVMLTTTDPLFFDSVVLQYNNRIIDGMARLRAQVMGCKPYLLTVWDYNLPSVPGSVADFIDHWGDPARLRMIDLDDLRVAANMIVDPVIPMPPLRAPSSSNYPNRVVRTMLFADIVGYSRLREADLPAFWRYMKQLAAYLKSHTSAPVLIESWGDALYVVHENPRETADYALALIHAFASLDGASHGLPEALNVRIGLHAGPVFSGIHPLTGNAIIYGSQVTLAARIEPIGRPGNIYASEQFVAALIASESLREGKREDMESLASDYEFEYLGTQELAKNYGRQAVYLLRAAPGNQALISS